VDKLDALPGGWRQTLRSASGIYLLTDAKGVHYVGSAKGGDGLLGRWQAYRGGRSGGNLGLKGATAPYTVSVLQTVDPAIPMRRSSGSNRSGRTSSAPARSGTTSTDLGAA
jgi:hypothetical protein